MTTIACNLREIAAETRVTQEGVGRDTYSSIKLYPAKNGAIYGVTGENCTGSIRAIQWLQTVERDPEAKPTPPDFDHGWSWTLIELSAAGIAVYNEYLERDPMIEPVMALGSGRKVALYCMRHLKMSPAEAVREACRVDHFSDLPIYRASLADPVVRRWTPPRRARAPKSPD